MKYLDFNVFLSGMSDETVSDKIMICKPYISVKISFDSETLEEYKLFHISQLIDFLKTQKAVIGCLGEYGLDNFKLSTTYLYYKNYLLGMKEDKPLSALFDFLNSDYIQFAHYYIAGGASRHCDGYRFQVHSDEDIHRNLPHIHVSRDGIDIRYHLETLEPIDKLIMPHKRDNRKIIKPFLLENQKCFLEMWSNSIHGYINPAIDEIGAQFYPES